MADVIAVGIPATDETEKARLPSENISSSSEKVIPPSADTDPPPKTVSPPSENTNSLPTGNVNLQPEASGRLAENESHTSDRLDDCEVNNKLDGAQIHPQVTEEESSKAAGGSISNILHGDIVPSNLNEKGNTLESPRDFQAADSRHTEEECSPKFSNNVMSNPSKKIRTDNVISKSIVSTTSRHLNSHFVDGSLPSYALPTVAFQIRISLTTDNVAQDNVPTCHRYYKSPSPLCHVHKRRRSHSLDNGLQLENGPKSDRCISAQPWKARPKGRTPLHGLPVALKSPRETDSRPSSARTDPSARGPSVKSLFAKEKSMSDSNSFQLPRKNVASAKSSQLSTSVIESETTTPGVKSTTSTTKTTDRPKSMSTRESPVSDDFSVKSKKAAWKQSAKSSPDKEFSSAHEPGLKSRAMEKVIPPGGSSTPTKDDKEKGKEVLPTSREPVSKAAPEKATSPTKSTHDRAPVRAPKSAEDRNITVGRQQGSRPALDTSVSKGTKAKQATPAKTPSSETPTRTQHAKSSPTKDVVTLAEARKDSSASNKSHSKTQETKSSHNKDVSVKKEAKKVPTPNREDASFASLAANKDVKPTTNEGESIQHSQPMKSSSTKKEKAKDVAAEKASATADSPSAPMDEYRAKLAENRKQAREKAEHEAEEERMRDVQARLAEEERKRKEEEEERRRDEEEMRLAEELRRAEEERYRRLVEETELRKKEDAERIEAEAKAKVEQETFAKEEAEKLDKLRQEKMKREEEEKQGRKKRLEAIMKRVKTDETVTKVEGSNAADDSSPPSDITLNQSMERSSFDSSPQQRDAISPASLADDSKTHFKSPLLQQLLTGRSKTPAVVVGSFIESDKKSANSEGPETMSCLYEEQKTAAEEPSRIVLSQEMAS